MAQKKISGNWGQNVFWGFFGFHARPILTRFFFEIQYFFFFKFFLDTYSVDCLNTIFFRNYFLGLHRTKSEVSLKWYKSHNSDFLDEYTPHGTVLTSKPKLFSSDWSPGMVVLKNEPNQNWSPKSCANLLGFSRFTHSNALKKLRSSPGASQAGLFWRTWTMWNVLLSVVLTRHKCQHEMPSFLSILF